jgi:cytochrome P450
MWVLTRYGDVEHVVTSPETFSVERFRRVECRPEMEAVRSVLRHWTVYRDPPDHTRLRALLGHSFTPRRLQALQPRVQAIVDQLLDRCEGRGVIDFIAEFAFPLPATVIAVMLGVPLEDIGQVRIWSNQIADFIGGARSGADAEHAGRGLLQACEYFRGLARRRRVHGGDDVLGVLLTAEERGETLTEDEVVANCVLLLFAGHETTTNLLGNGLHHLLRHPAQEALLRARPDLVPSAVEEFLRYDAPVAGTIRIVTEDVELDGRMLHGGDAVAAMLAAANRDPRRFERPDDLDVTRAPNRHLSFGLGTHFCLGASLARLEAQTAFQTLLRRFRRLTLADDPPRWKPQVFFRELVQLPVSLEA